MLWILLATYYLGGGLDGVNGSLLTAEVVGQLSKNAAEVIDDPDRATAAQETLRELKKEIKSFDKVFSESGKQLTKSYKQHDADRDQALAVLDHLNSNWETMQSNAIELRFELREQVSEEEWGKIFAPE